MRALFDTGTPKGACSANNGGLFIIHTQPTIAIIVLAVFEKVTVMIIAQGV